MRRKVAELFQRGHWRIVFPYSRFTTGANGESLLDHLKTRDPVVVHIVRFPQLTINHAVVFYDATEKGDDIDFKIYDPNDPAEPRHVTYKKSERTFFFAANDYFPGGRIDAYEVYHRWNY